MSFEIVNPFVAITGKIKNLISSIRADKNPDKLLNELQRANITIEKLADNIYFAPKLNVLSDTTRELKILVSDLRLIKDALEPVAHNLGRPIISTEMISTPEKMQKIIRIDPWSVLDNIRPISLVKPHTNPEMVPIMFEFDGVRYIGWQMQGALSSLFNVEYNSSISNWNQQDEETQDEEMRELNENLQESARSKIISSEQKVEKPFGVPKLISSNLSTAEKTAFNRLLDGASPDSVVKELTRKGVADNVARGLVAEVSHALKNNKI